MLATILLPLLPRLHVALEELTNGVDVGLREVESGGDGREVVLGHLLYLRTMN